MSTLPSPIPEIDFKTNTAPLFPFVSMDHISKSPLNPAAFKKVLENHPDRHWVENVVLPLVSSNGLQLTYSKKGTGPGKAALAVRPTHRPALLKSIWKDLDHKRIAGPYTYDSLPAIAKSRAHFNPFFAIAKSEPGKFRPVINMSDGGKTPIRPARELASFGYALAIWPAMAALSASAAMERAMQHLKAEGTSLSPDVPLFAFDDFCRMVGFEEVWKFEEKWKDVLQKPRG